MAWAVQREALGLRRYRDGVPLASSPARKRSRASEISREGAPSRDPAPVRTSSISGSLRPICAGSPTPRSIHAVHRRPTSAIPSTSGNQAASTRRQQPCKEGLSRFERERLGCSRRTRPAPRYPPAANRQSDHATNRGTAIAESPLRLSGWDRVTSKRSCEARLPDVRAGTSRRRWPTGWRAAVEALCVPTRGWARMSSEAARRHARGASGCEAASASGWSP